MSAASATLVCECVLLAACPGNEDVPAPHIASIEPDHAASGAIVTLRGDHFCQQPEELEDAPCDIVGQVYFGTQPGTAAIWTDAAIAVEVPAGLSGEVGVQVLAAGRRSNAVELIVE